MLLFDWYGKWLVLNDVGCWLMLYCECILCFVDEVM